MPQKQYIHTGNFRSQNINHLTEFFYYKPQEESLENFLKRVKDSIPPQPIIYGARYIAVVEEMVFDMKEFYSQINRYNLDPVKTFLEFKEAKKSLNQKYPITPPSPLQDRPLILLESCSSGRVDHHHAAVANWAKQFSHTRYLVITDSHGVHDTAILMQLTSNQMCEYIMESTYLLSSILSPHKIQKEFDECLQKLQSLIDQAPPTLKSSMALQLSQFSHPHVLEKVLQCALTTVSQTNAAMAARVEDQHSVQPQHFIGGK